MDFLGVVPKLQIAEHGGRDHMCFTADLFETRPSFGEMLAYRPMATSVEQLITKLMARKTCAFVYVGIFVDERGAVVLAKAKRGMQLDNARCGISTILAPLPAEQRLCVSKSLHAFDELDKVRMNTWSTVASLRPKFPKAPKDPTSATDSGCGLPMVPQSAQQLLLELVESDDEDDGPRTLAITNGAVPRIESPEMSFEESDQYRPEMSFEESELYREGHARARATWTTSAKQQAVVVILSVGSRLEELSYIHCHREERRVALLCAMLPALPDLCETVAIAAQMAQEGSLPSSSGPRARKAEFLKRCEAALKAKNPRAERDVKKVPREDQQKIALALNTAGTDTLCSRCPKPAVASLEFSLAWLDGIPEPNADIKYFCANCKPSHAAVCGKCGRHDSLEHGARPLPPMQFMGVHVLRDIHCTACRTLAIAPMTVGEKRKRDADWLVEGVKRGAFRCIPPA